MESIWEILGIEKTDDVRVIRRAYGAMAAKYNPEEHPEEFLRIREAYERALKEAEETGQGGVQSREPLGWGVLTQEAEGGTQEGSADGSTTWEQQTQQSFRWDFTEENPYREGPAIQKFRELYLGKRNKDRTAWSDFFLSDDFLAAHREPDFLSLMLNTVQENMESYPPGKEFLTELYITYGLEESHVTGGKIEPEAGAAFDGIEKVIEITGLGPVISRFKGNDDAMKCGFRDYRQLLRIMAEGPEQEKQLLLLGKIVDRYTLSNISDKPIRDAWQYELSQRHPKSIRLLSHFYAHFQLPEKAYRIAWDHLHLGNTLYGKEKLLYGDLKEAVLAHMPALAEKPKLDYQKILSELQEYGGRCIQAGTESTEARAETDKLFAWEDFQNALLDQWFVEQELLKYYISRHKSRYYIERLEEFYQSHKDAPFREQVLEKIKYWWRDNRVKLELEEDAASVLERGPFDFGKRAYVRYYLNAGFRRARGLRDYNVDLKSYLEKYMPASPEWTGKLLDPEAGGFSPKSPAASISFGEEALQIFFHPRHIEYRWGGKKYGPYYPWELLRDAEDTLFWLLLPIAQASFQEHGAVYQELERRLSGLPLHQEDVSSIADCITGKICRFGEDMEYNQPVFTFYEEQGERLLGCDIFRDGVLAFFEETDKGEQQLPVGQYQAQDMDMAASIADRIFGEMRASDEGGSLALPECMPGRLILRDQWGALSTLEGEQVTQEALLENLEQYFEGKRVRVELDWDGVRSLVFLKERKLPRYLCMYFDHQKYAWNALVAQPEIYAVTEADQVVYMPFGRGLLPTYLVHQNINLIRGKLKDIFCQLGTEQPKPAPMMWDSHVYRTRKEQRYHRDMRVCGDFLPEQAKNPLTADFDLSVLPAKLTWTDLEGQQRESVIDPKRDALLVQDRLRDYMSGRLLTLSLIWQWGEQLEGQFEAQMEGREQQQEANPPVRAIELMQDVGKHRMLYVDEKYKAREWFVSDVREYLRAEGKKFHKTTFLGKTVPGYLVHENLERIRDCLDLLLPVIEDPSRIVNTFGEFSHE